MLRQLTRIPTILAVAATILLAAGCGGGGGVGAALASFAGEIGGGGTGIAILTGFGSLFMDGMRRDDTLAVYSSEEDQGTSVTVPSTAAMLGHMLEYGYGNDGALTSVMMSPQLVGQVSAVSTTGFTVLGTSVTTNTDPALGPVTTYAGYASTAAIQIGDRIAVYGHLKTDPQGNTSVQATMIMQKTQGTGIRLTGYVAQLNAAAGTFSIGSHTVNMSAAAIAPAGTTLANGGLVTVWSDSAPIGKVIAASNIRVKLAAPASGNLTLSGVVSANSGSSFKLLNVAVDASKASLIPAGTAIANGNYVIVTGQFDAASGRLAASSVTLYSPTASSAVELHGTVLNYVSASSFTVRGAVVDASTATFTGGAARDLANGVFVVITGSVSNNTVKASTVNIVALTPAQAPAGATVDLMGTITGYNATTGAYTLSLGSGLAMNGMMGSGLMYINGSSGSLAVGQSVMVRGLMNGNTLTTSVVSFAQSASNPSAGTGPGTPTAAMSYMEGVAYNVTATSFMLNGLPIQSNGIAVSGGGMMGGRGMMSGSRVGVSVQYANGQYMATAITLLGS